MVHCPVSEPVFLCADGDEDLEMMLRHTQLPSSPGAATQPAAGEQVWVVTYHIVTALTSFSLTCSLATTSQSRNGSSGYQGRSGGRLCEELPGAIWSAAYCGLLPEWMVMRCAPHDTCHHYAHIHRYQLAATGGLAAHHKETVSDVYCQSVTKLTLSCDATHSGLSLCVGTRNWRKNWRKSKIVRKFIRKLQSELLCWYYYYNHYFVSLINCYLTGLLRSSMYDSRRNETIIACTIGAYCRRRIDCWLLLRGTLLPSSPPPQLIYHTLFQLKRSALKPPASSERT